jgi:hypothetical protein
MHRRLGLVVCAALVLIAPALATALGNTSSAVITMNPGEQVTF